MAQGFARRYGADVMTCESAGLAPAAIVQPLTKKVMQDKNISIDDQYPKDVDSIAIRNFHLIVNMSGAKLPGNMTVPVRDWPIEDPIGRPEEIYVAVRDQIEMAVMQLILEMRRDIKRSQPPARRPRNAPSGVSQK
jgi:protein-tyrosine-phosphatase